MNNISIWLILMIILIIISIMFILLRLNSRLRNILITCFFWIIGAISLLLGIIGAFLPVMPTVPFILLTAMCWGKASPRFHQWIRQHHWFGLMVVNWEERRAISKKGKYLAWIMMSISCVMLFWRMPHYWWVGVIVSLICLSVGIWMAKLPNA